MRAKITGLGKFIPPAVESSAELAPKLGVTEDWIISRTGVINRHVHDGDMASLAARAAEEALGDGPPPDLILNASGVPHQVIPDSSTYIQDALGFAGLPSYSIHATCLSFAVALNTAASIVHSGLYKRVLVVSADMGTWGRNYDEPESACLFGDGAGAAVLEPTPEGESSEFLAWQMGTWPKGAPLTEVRGGGTGQHPNNPATTEADNLFHMDGPAVYKMARRRVAVVLKKVFVQAGLDRDQVDLVVPHQASGPAVDVLEHYGFPLEKVVSIVGETGNCVAASMPMALATAHEQGRLKRGDLLLMAGTGAGLSVAALLLRW
jgi:3-oxoacyl-[acyl-carrier-protein] synthase III